MRPHVKMWVLLASSDLKSTPRNTRSDYNDFDTFSALSAKGTSLYF